jgi:hypothetical protein
VNGDFETGTDGNSSLTPIAGWTDSGTSAGFWLQDGTGGGSFPQDPSEPQSGVLYLSANRFSGGSASQPSSSTLSQVVAIDSGDLALVQAGTAGINLTFYYHDTDDNDTGTVIVEFLDSSSQMIGSGSTGSLVNTASNGTAYDLVNVPWTLVTLTEPLPVGTEYVRIKIETNRTGGSATNVHFDNFAAEIVPTVPPVASPRWVPYDGGARTTTTVGAYFTVPFMPVSETPTSDSMKIAGAGQSAPIHYSTSDAEVVRIAAEALAEDIERVTGIPASASTADPSASEVILIGTVGSSPLIDSLVSSGKIDVSAIQGKWEAYTAAVVENPISGITRALVIAGSDRRGTAFGVFALSESMGVSPWYFWGDVPTPQKPGLHISGTHTQGSPGVKYRGIFLNDEDWGLQPWAAKTFEPEVGNIGPKTYATIFELLLRLHSNIIWPAMHEWPVMTAPFYTVPGNKEAADDYAIVISTSHHEPMLRNSHEFDTATMGEYNYWTNSNTIYNFWDQRVAETADYENIYTIGMRGRADAGVFIPPGEDIVDMLGNTIIPDQRQMISDHVNPDPSQVPQIFIPYKETLTYYNNGLDALLPEDVTILWVDDNHGYIRQLSNSSERARSGGSGVYYHLSYWGVPESYLWFCSTPPGMTRSEMMKAWDFDANKMWLVNVGDIKPMEIGTEFFLRMARDPEAFRDFDQHAYFTQWATRNFGPLHADAIASVLNDYFRLNIVTRPEHLNLSNAGFSMVKNGDEAQKRLDEFAALRATAETIYNQLPASQKPAFYEMVLYGIRGSDLANRHVLKAERSRLWADQGRAATAVLAAEANADFDALIGELDFYNLTNADGKWNHMMSPGHGNWNGVLDPFNTRATVGSYSPPASSSLGVAIEGSEPPLDAGTPGELPRFNRTAESISFIDVFNLGTNPMSWTAVASAPWITLSQTSGTSDARITVGIDWNQAPRGYAVPGTVTIQGSGDTRTVNLRAFYPLDLNLATLPAAVEDNGVVTIEAEDFTDQHDRADGAGWRRADEAAASQDGMTIQPVTAASLDPSNIPADTPSLTYQFHAFSTGSLKIRTECLPTHKITSDHPGVRYAISLNGDTPKIVNVNAAEYSAAWNVNTLRAAAYGISSHSITAPGLQTLKVWMVDAGVVLDKFVIEIATGLFEAENLSVQESSKPAVTFTDPPASGAAGLHIQSTAVNDFATVVIPGLGAGDYQLTLRVKKWTNRGIIQMSVAQSPTGPFVDIGGLYDLYDATGLYADIGPVPVTFTAGGPKYIKFTITGKNPAATNYWILLDTLTFKPVISMSGVPIQNWRNAFFGTTNGVGDAADLADPDRDGIPNLMEYATGSYPTVPGGSPTASALVGDHLVLTFNRARDATDVIYRVLAGDDLPPTTPIWSSETTPYPGGSAPFFQTSVTDPQEIGDSATRFLILKVERP